MTVKTGGSLPELSQEVRNYLALYGYEVKEQWTDTQFWLCVNQRSACLYVSPTFTLLDIKAFVAIQRSDNGVIEG